MINANLSEASGGWLKFRKSILSSIERRFLSGQANLKKAHMRTMTRKWPDRMIIKSVQLQKRNDEKSVSSELFGNRNCPTL